MAKDMESLAEYIDQIVDPTFADFGRNPTSGRHAYLACVAAFHAVDRATFPKRSASLRGAWRKQSFAFLIVDMVAHHLKHVMSDLEKGPVPKGTMPLDAAVFIGPHDNPDALGLDLHNLYYLIRDAIAFLRTQVSA